MRTIERSSTSQEKASEAFLLESASVDNLDADRYRTAFSAMIIGIVIMIVASLFIYTLAGKLDAMDRMAALKKLTTIKSYIEDVILEAEVSLQTLRMDLLQQENITEESFNQMAEAAIEGTSYVKALSWSPQGATKYIYPKGPSKQQIETHITASVQQDINVAEGSVLQKLQIETPLNKHQLRRLILHIPLQAKKIKSQGNGVVSVEVDINKYTASMAFRDKLKDFRIAIKQSDIENSIFLVGDQRAFSNQELVKTRIKIGRDNWLIMTLVDETSKQKLSFIWFVATLISIVLTLISYKTISIYKQRSVDVEAGAYRANYDLLTGLPNRYHFSRRLNDAIEEAQREQSDFAIFFMDIDHFKQINDQLGHGVGDAILTQFSARLEASTKNSDLAARISGDEFIFVSRYVADVIKADLLAEKLKKHLQQPIEFGGQQHFITVSMGIAMYPIDGDDVSTLLQHSDQAMYAAKRAGRNQHFFFNEGMREEAEHYLAVHTDLLRGLGMGEFELYYQPVMHVKTKSIEVCEALIRWHHPEKGLIMPDQFIRIAERTGAIREIGNWAFSQACRDLRTFADVDIDVKIAINHSVSEYYSSRAFERWKRTLSENGVSGDRFIFEIPEALLMDKKSIRMSVVTAMRKMGVQFAIDDFGTGHSAINYLRNYPADILKIDASLIQGMQQNDKDKTLVEVVLTLGKSLGKQVVAEGVENDMVAQELKRLNCDYLQGNWLIEPMPIRRLIPYLHQHIFDVEDQQKGVEV